VNQAVAENGDGGDAEDCTVNGANAAKDAGAAEDNRSDGIKFIAGSGVGFGLTDTGRVDDRRESGDEARKDVCQSNSTFDANASVAGTLRREANRAEGASECGSMDEEPDDDQSEKKNWGLSGNAEKTFLAKEKKPSGKTKKRIHTMSDSLCKTTKE